MLNTRNVKTISDMRKNALGILKQTKSSGPLYLFYRSKPQAVFLSLVNYQRLKDIAEDYFDSLKAQEFEKEDKKKIKWTGHEQLKKELGI